MSAAVLPNKRSLAAARYILWILRGRGGYLNRKTRHALRRVLKSRDPETRSALERIQQMIADAAASPPGDWTPERPWAGAPPLAHEALKHDLWVSVLVAMGASREGFQHNPDVHKETRQRLNQISKQAQKLADSVDEYCRLEDSSIGIVEAAAFRASVSHAATFLLDPNAQQPLAYECLSEFLRALAEYSRSLEAVSGLTRNERSDGPFAPRIRAFDEAWKVLARSGSVVLEPLGHSETAGVLRELWSDDELDFTSDVVGHVRRRR